MKSNWNYPTTMWVGKDRVKDLSIACKTLNINKPLLVTDSGLAKSKIVINVLKNLKERWFLVELYSNVIGNPTGTNVTEGADYYNKNNCDGVVAFGGGSGLDVGKGNCIYVRSNPSLFGILKMLVKIGLKQILIKLHQLLLYQQLLEQDQKQDEHL